MDLSVLASVVSAAAASGALVMVAWQIRLQTKQLRFEALTRLHDLLISVQMHNDLRLIYATQASALAAPSSPETLQALERVLAMYDMIGFRVREGVLPKDSVLKTEWTVLLRLWAQSKAFVVAERQRRGVPYKDDFEWLVNEAKTYKSRHFPFVDVEVFPREFPQASTSANTPAVALLAAPASTQNNASGK